MFGTGFSTTTRQHFPNPRSKDAPSKFIGRYYKIRPLLLFYEQPLTACRICDAKNKCEYVLLYVSSKVAQLIRVLPKFISHDWDKFKDKLLYLYDADKDTRTPLGTEHQTYMTLLRVQQSNQYDH